MWIPIMKIRRSQDNIIFIPHTNKDGAYIETGPMTSCVVMYTACKMEGKTL